MRWLPVFLSRAVRRAGGKTHQQFGLGPQQLQALDHIMAEFVKAR